MDITESPYKSSLTNKVIDIFRGVTLIILIICQIFVIPLCYVCTLLLLQPIKYIIPKTLYRQIEKNLYENCILVVSYWTDLAGHQVFECGEDVSHILENERCLVIANHQRPSDIGIIMRAFQNKSNFFRTNMWILDWVLQFLTFGWVCRGHGDFFLLQPVDAKRFSNVFGHRLFGSWEGGKQQINTLQDTVDAKFASKQFTSVILFPEGGFLDKRRSGSERYARRINHQVLKHITLPRIGAFEAVLKGMLRASKGSDVWIVDVTLGYRKPITMWQHMFRFHHPKEKFVVHFRTFRLDKSFTDAVLHMPDSNKVRDWLFSRFTEKDHLLAHFYEQNKFPTPTSARPSSPLPVWPYLLFHIWSLFLLYLLPNFFW